MFGHMELNFDVKEASLANIISFNLQGYFVTFISSLDLLTFISPDLKDILPSSGLCSWLHLRVICWSGSICS